MFSNIFLRGMMLMNNVRYTVVDHIRKIQCEGNAWDFLDDDGGDGGIFGGLKKSIEQSGAAFVGLARSAALSIVVVAIIMLGVHFVLTHNGPKLQELKEHIPWALVGIVMVVGCTLLLYLGQSVADGIIASLQQK